MGLHKSFDRAGADDLAEAAERAGVSAKGTKAKIIERLVEALPDGDWLTRRGLSHQVKKGEFRRVCEKGEAVPDAILTLSGHWMYARGWLYREGEE